MPAHMSSYSDYSATTSVFESKYAENGDVRQPYVYQSFAQNDGIIMFHPLSETGFSVGRKIPFRTA